MPYNKMIYNGLKNLSNRINFLGIMVKRGWKGGKKIR
jgi:hypothetical protein